jgi:hypothetical protein
MLPAFRLSALCLSLSGCAIADYAQEHPLEFNNIEADEAQYLERNPELADRLQLLSVPQDDNWHFGANIARLHDRQTGAPIGWAFGFNCRHALPFPRPSVVRPTPTPVGTPPIVEREYKSIVVRPSDAVKKSGR